MTEPKVKRTSILPSDIDPAGNVTLWDHGPVDFKPAVHESAELQAERKRVHEADAASWHDVNGDGPIAVVLHSSDASHALMIDPDRYALEPDVLDEGEIKKRMDEMKAKRLASANYEQDAIDRRIAIAAIISDKAQAKAIQTSEAGPAPAAKGFTTGPAGKTYQQIVAEQKARDDKILAEKDTAAKQEHDRHVSGQDF
jgi:hypothetical protein